MTNFPQPDNRDSKFIGYRIKRDENLGIKISRWNYDEYVSLWSSSMDTHHVPFRQTKNTKDTVKPRESVKKHTLKAKDLRRQQYPRNLNFILIFISHVPRGGDVFLPSHNKIHDTHIHCWKMSKPFISFHFIWRRRPLISFHFTNFFKMKWCQQPWICFMPFFPFFALFSFFLFFVRGF